ncbi:hypothetical protein FQZ97_729150 [compost metagenome]
MDPASYGFPLENPFEATIVTSPPRLRPELPSRRTIIQSDYRLAEQTTREFTPQSNFWAVDRLSYRLARQPHAAPLVFVIAGTGANYSSRTPEFLKRLFYGDGYHVVQLSSPTSYDFMVAASRNATPGISSADAEDLYQVMRAIRAQHPDLPVTEFHMVGYSLGGLNAAFISHLDESRRAFNFKKVLLINPPVNLYTSISNLDLLVQAKVNGLKDSTFFDMLLTRLATFFKEQGYIDLNDALIYDFQRSDQRLSDEEMAMLIGSVFRLSVTNLVFTSDALNHRGLVTPAGLQINQGTSLTPFMKRALQCNFDCYLHQQVLPFWRARFRDGAQARDDDVEQLNQQVSLYALEGYLRDNRKLGVMHNTDDFILGPGDLGFLRRTFGDRLTLYPRGGHCGNLNYRDNSAAILAFFRD